MRPVFDPSSFKAPLKITEGSNIGKKRTVPYSSRVNVKKTKSESSQQTQGLAPDPGAFYFYLAYS